MNEKVLFWVMCFSTYYLGRKQQSKAKKSKVKIKHELWYTVYEVCLDSVCKCKDSPAKKLNFISLTLIKWNQIYNLFSKNAVL